MTRIILLFVFLFNMLYSCRISAARLSFLNVSNYSVISQDCEDEDDNIWSTYLYNHLIKRISDKERVLKKHSKESCNIYVDFNSSLLHGYEIECTSSDIHLRARDKGNMLWLLYQLIASIGKEDVRVSIDDLPPARIEMENQNGDFTFEYRGLYTPSNADADMCPILGTHNVDFDWGLWGHNLNKILKDNSSNDVYALVNGKRDKRQLCFSSEILYKKLVEYIIDNYGDENSMSSERFAILPNDNSIVCTCGKCRQQGNTQNNATPASAYMIRKLAERFPNHRFFMSAYRTTLTPPKESMPSNTGVLISAIDLPFGKLSEYTPEVKSFSKSIQQWKSKLPLIYIWDYMRNFDDYLTPFPCINIIQKRLQYYNSIGVKGVFFNGSGDDYASFDDLQTFVLSGLMANPYIETEKLIDIFLQTKYQSSNKEIAIYYKELERHASLSTKPFSLYGGIEDAEKSYLDTTMFFKLYNKMPYLISKAKASERTKLLQLYTALNFTALEIERASAKMKSSYDRIAAIEQLSTHNKYKNMRAYRESIGDINTYLKEWEQKINHDMYDSKIYGQQLELLGTNEKSTTMLSDGQFGFASDYHTGWFITDSKEWGIELPVNRLSTSENIKISFLHCPTWNIYVPKSINILVNGTNLLTVAPTVSDNDKAFQRIEQEIPLDSIKGNKIEVMFIRQDKKSKIACDEIILN